MRTIPRVLLVIGALSVPHFATAGPIVVLANQTAFENAFAVTNVPIPSSAAVFGASCGTPVGQTGQGPSVTIPFGSNSVTITDPASGRICIFDSGAIIPDNNTVPNVMIANTIVGNGEDIYNLTFSQPVAAVALRLLTNNIAAETLTFFDSEANVIGIDDIAALTDPNTRAFIGFFSPTTPISSVLLQTEGGAVQNEGFDLLEVGIRVPEPATDLLLIAGVFILRIFAKNTGSYRS